jgi:hypothetical protein
VVVANEYATSAGATAEQAVNYKILALKGQIGKASESLNTAVTHTAKV